MKKLHVVYHPQYLNYHFGPAHPFWPQRAKEFLLLLKNSGLDYQLVEPSPAQEEDILLAHSEKFLEQLKDKARKEFPLAPDTPFNQKLLKAAYYYVGGTIKALQLALQEKPVINLLGGLHHAGISQTSGFCVFNDHAIAIKKLQKQQKIKTAFVLDIDAHAGQGTQEIFYSDPSVFTLSIHQDPHTLYPGTSFAHQKGEGRGEGYNLNLPLPAGSGAKEFFPALQTGLEKLASFKADLNVVVFGVDTFKDDPLTNLNLTAPDYQKIGKKLRSLRPAAVLCAGGYSRRTPKLWLNFLHGWLS